MSSDGVVNLNRARKARARAEGEAKAAQNRVAFGRTGVEKATDRREAERAGRTLDAHKRDPKEP